MDIWCMLVTKYPLLSCRSIKRRGESSEFECSALGKSEEVKQNRFTKAAQPDGGKYFLS